MMNNLKPEDAGVAQYQEMAEGKRSCKCTEGAQLVTE